MTEIEMCNILAAYTKELSEADGLYDKGVIQLKHAKILLQMLDQARKDEREVSKKRLLEIASILSSLPNIKLENCRFVNLWQLAEDIKQSTITNKTE